MSNKIMDFVGAGDSARRRSDRAADAGAPQAEPKGQRCRAMTPGRTPDQGGTPDRRIDELDEVPRLSWPTFDTQAHPKPGCGARIGRVRHPAEPDTGDGSSQSRGDGTVERSPDLKPSPASRRQPG